MLIKVCGLNDPENYKDIADLNVDYLGMIFYPKSPRYVEKNPELFMANNCEKVGVFVNESAENILKLQNKYLFTTVQLHGKENNDLIASLKNKGLKVWKALGIYEDFDFTTLNNYPDADLFVFDTFTKQHGGSGKKFNWQLLVDKEIPKPFLLSGGIDVLDSNSIKEFNHKKFLGVDVNSKFEIRPGLKDSKKVQELIKALKQ